MNARYVSIAAASLAALVMGIGPAAAQTSATDSPSTPGGSVTVRVRLRAVLPGQGRITTWMRSPLVPGLTVATQTITVAADAGCGSTSTHPCRRRR